MDLPSGDGMINRHRVVIGVFYPWSYQGQAYILIALQYSYFPHDEVITERTHQRGHKTTILDAQRENKICFIQTKTVRFIRVKIGRTVAEMWRFNSLFSKWRPSAILDLLGAYWDHPR